MMYLRHQEAKLGIMAAWILAPLGGTLSFFYLGTIWASTSDLDLQLVDIQRGLTWAGLGLILGALFALGVTLFYPKYINQEFDTDHSH